MLSVAVTAFLPSQTAEAQDPTVDYIVIFAASNDVEGNGPGEVFAGSIFQGHDIVLNGLTLHGSCSDLFNLYDKQGQNYIPLARDATNEDWGFSETGGDPTAGTDERRLWDFKFFKYSNETTCGNAELIPDIPAIDLVKGGAYTSGDGSSVGDVVTYTFDVTNTGNVTLTNVVVTDPLSGLSAITCNPAQGSTLAPGESMACTATYAITQGDIDAGQVDNLATATGTPPVGDDVTDTDPHTVPTGQTPAIELIKTGAFEDESGDGFAQPGETISYQFTVTNIGNVTLTGITLQDTIGGVTVGGGPIASLDPGESDSTTFTGSYVVTQADIDAGSFANLATACGTPPVGADVCDDDPEIVPLPQDPSIDVRKGPSGAATDEGPDFTSVQLGDPHTFFIVVTNTGNVTLSGVAVSDPVTPNCATSLGALAPGDSVAYTCGVASVASQIDNVATASGLDPSGGTVSDSDPSTVFAVGADGQIGDTVWQDDDGDGVQDAGEPGIPGATVWLKVGGSIVATTVTNVDGMYLFSALDAGTYRAELDTSTVTGNLTTPGFFDVVLADGEHFLDADFGVREELPVTGIDADRITWYGLMVLALGGMLLLGAGRRRETA